MAKRLASFVYVDGKAYGPDDDIPAEVAKAITNPKAWADDAAQSESGDSGEPDQGYSKLKVADLKAEIAARNADRGDEAKILITAQAKHDDLVAALEADDAAQSESEDSGDGS